MTHPSPARQRALSARRETTIRAWHADEAAAAAAARAKIEAELAMPTPVEKEQGE